MSPRPADAPDERPSVPTRERVGDVVTADGLPLPVVSIELTDEVWGPRVIALLSHKEPVYLAHLEAARAGRTPNLRTRFHLATLGESVVAVIMVASSGRYGVLGHVYTVPEHRKQGISSQLLGVALAREERLGVTRLSLAVAPGSSAARIYERHGFTAALPARDAMFRAGGGADAGCGEARAAGSDVEVAPLAWRDWPGLDWAMMRPVGDTEPLPRSPLFGVEMRGYAEGAFLVAVLEADPSRAGHAVLRAADGGVTGWCAWQATSSPEDAPARLDLHVAPGFEAFLPQLVATVGSRGCVYRSRSSHPAYDEALRGAGFRPGDHDTEGWQRWVR